MKDFTLKYTDNDNEKILLRKINDFIRKSEKNYCTVYSNFLTPAEQSLISEIDEFKGYIDFDGGYENAERRLCRIKANEYCHDDALPIKLYSLIAPADAEFSHRDVLGSLMGLGIKREMTGDIIVDGRKAHFFCCNPISEFVELNFKKIGHYPIILKQDMLSEIPVPKTKDININVSSMRIDSIAAECFGISRTKAADFIKRGLVSVNWLVCTNTSKEVKSGDKISMRGKGKVEICGISGKSKKGRLFVDIKKYV